MEYSLIIIMVALIQYQWFGFRVGFGRGKYGVPAPKCTGNDTWERLFRIHQNTLEQLIVFIPALLAFTFYVSTKWAIVLGLAFIIARQIYSLTYLKNPPKRMFPPTFLINAILMIGSIVGIVMQLRNTRG
jgi:glutathione S-transferase